MCSLQRKWQALKVTYALGMMQFVPISGNETYSDLLRPEFYAAMHSKYKYGRVFLRKKAPLAE